MVHFINCFSGFNTQYSDIFFFADFLHCKSYSHFFQQKNSAYLRITVNFNESLTNDVVSFEQLGPDVVP